MDGDGRLRERHEGDEQGSEAADVVEVTVGDEEVPDALGRDAGVVEPPEQDGPAGGGVYEYRLVFGQRDGQARLRPLLVERVAGAEEDYTSQATPPERRRSRA